MGKGYLAELHKHGLLKIPEAVPEGGDHGPPPTR